MIKSYTEHIISVNNSAREALKRLETLPDSESRTLFIIDNNEHLVGTITDGDIRRGLLNDLEISEEISKFMNQKYKFIDENDTSLNSIKELKDLDIDFVPVINRTKNIIRILNLKVTRTVIPAAALIMAGGRGERLRPFTDTIPKPMLLVGDKPIIERNIDRLIQFGITNFYISVKYLGEHIKQYFGDGSSRGVKINYIEEDNPLGTIGALSKLPGLEFEDLLVMNSDILTNIDFEDFFSDYKASNASMSIASIPYSVKVPYAVLETNDRQIHAFTEKPEYTYYSNAGIYFIKTALKSEIPYNSFFNATDLMQQLINQGKCVCHYPLLGYWLDIGKHQDYIKAQEDIKHINF